MGFNDFADATYVQAEREYLTSANAKELYEQHYSDIDPNVFLGILKMDPTFDKDSWYFDWKDAETKPFGVFTKQLILWHKRDNQMYGISPRDFRKSLLEYQEYQKWLPPKFDNINKFKTADDFFHFMSTQLKDLTASRREEKAKKEATVFAEDEDWLIIIPHSYFASVYFGEGSRWCTASPAQASHYNGYTADGTLYMCMSKHDRTASIQIFIPHKDAEGYDEVVVHQYDDHRIYWGDVEESIDELFKSKGVDLESAVSDAGGDPDEEEHTFYTEEIYGDANDRDTFRFYASETEYHQVGDNDPDDGEQTVAESMEVTIDWFDLSKLDPEVVSSDLEAFGDLDLTQPGLVLTFEGYAGLEELGNALDRAANGGGDRNSEWEYDFDEWLMNFLGASRYTRDDGSGMKKLADRITDPDWKGPCFVLALFDGKQVSANDDILLQVADVLKVTPAGGNTQDRRSVFTAETEVEGSYDGNQRYMTFIPLVNGGVMENAMDKGSFRKWLGVGLEDVASWPEQEKADRQQELQF